MLRIGTRGMGHFGEAGGTLGCRPVGRLGHNGPVTHDRSEALFARASAVTPGGVNSPVRAFRAVGGTPRFIRSASGARLTDVDGREYVDLVGSWGPMLLGHAHPEVMAAVQQALARGTSYGAPTEAEVDLAEEVTPALVDPKLAVGRTLAQIVRPGQTLRQTHLKSRQWFVAGETVRVVATGAGFALESEAQALSNGIEGQPARVRTESGRVLTGLPSGERRLEVGL